MKPICQTDLKDFSCLVMLSTISKSMLHGAQTIYDWPKTPTSWLSITRSPPTTTQTFNPQAPHALCRAFAFLHVSCLQYFAPRLPSMSAATDTR